MASESRKKKIQYNGRMSLLQRKIYKPVISNNRKFCQVHKNCILHLFFTFTFFALSLFLTTFIIPPTNEVAGVYSDPYVRPFVRSSVHPSVRPSQFLIRYSPKTAEQNFMKLSGIVHYMIPYCTSYFKILFEWFWSVPEQNKDFAIQNMGERGVSFCEHCSQYF